MATERRFLTLPYGETNYVSGSRSLARHILFEHLKTLDVPLHTFLGLSDPNWIAYQKLKKVGGSSKLSLLRWLITIVAHVCYDH